MRILNIRRREGVELVRDGISQTARICLNVVRGLAGVHPCDTITRGTIIADMAILVNGSMVAGNLRSYKRERFCTV